jgi:hypothetical protein
VILLVVVKIENYVVVDVVVDLVSVDNAAVAKVVLQLRS